MERIYFKRIIKYDDNTCWNSIRKQEARSKTKINKNYEQIIIKEYTKINNQKLKQTKKTWGMGKNEPELAVIPRSVHNYD